MARAYVGGRKSADPAKTERAIAEAVGDWQRMEIRNALGQKFRASMQVEIRRPWWMPGLLYRALMRAVVVHSRLERLKVSKLERPNGQKYMTPIRNSIPRRVTPSARIAQQWKQVTEIAADKGKC
jgi:hypothetical protein